MTESSSVVANASPAAEREAIIVSSLNLGDDLGTGFPLKCINSQPRTWFKWLSLSDGSWVAGWCPLRVWGAARWECPSRSWEGGMPHSHTQGDKQRLGRQHIDCPLGSLALTTVTRSVGGAVSQMVLWLVGVEAVYTTVRNSVSFLPRRLYLAHVCVTCVSNPGWLCHFWIAKKGGFKR